MKNIKNTSDNFHRLRLRIKLLRKRLRKRLRKCAIFLIVRLQNFKKRSFKRVKGFLITIFAISYSVAYLLHGIFRNQTKQQQSLFRLGVIVPNDFRLEKPNFNGGTKDIQSTLEQLSEMGISYELFHVSRTSSHALYTLLREPSRFFSISHIIVSIPGASGLIIPYLKILGFSEITFRSHNAELLHRWDWIKSSKSVWIILKSIKKMIFGFFSDFFVSLFASNILSVSEKEIDIYWSVLFPWSRRKLKFFPGVSPSHIGNGHLFREHEGGRRTYATIVGGFEGGTVISRADRHFINQGHKIKKYFNAMGFRLVSVGSSFNLDFCDINFGFVDNYLEILHNSEIVIVPTSNGWGFKTKIADAVTLHQSVIVTETLYNRLGIWRQMVSPIRDWADIPNLKVRTFSAEEYQSFLIKIMYLRRKILLDLIQK